jgi:23S rRNA (pseudouridine1915-N3)-methyltransferase
MKIHLVMVGKTKRAEARALFEDYVARIGRYAEVQCTELRDAGAWKGTSAGKKFDSSAVIVLLDAAGKQWTSAEFAAWLGKQRDGGVRELVFLCGDAGGFPESMREAARMKISLSSLTTAHELARVMLAEQIYRGFAILAGHPYPK